ncbi:MAG: tRNA epoxyqueuosine(34) reductase QueG, partial [Mesorhizobium sp.]|uniref:HEAT repeat domain-containing protein n=1 Tax=Mesorhizobium sp. TaxID=1871066 RepID=UPI000FEAA26E
TPIVRGLLDDSSPLVRGAAVWALSRLMPARDFAARAASALQTEGDATVRDEWFLVLSDPTKDH